MIAKGNNLLSRKTRNFKSFGFFILYEYYLKIMYSIRILNAILIYRIILH